MVPGPATPLARHVEDLRDSLNVLCDAGDALKRNLRSVAACRGTVGSIVMDRLSQTEREYRLQNAKTILAGHEQTLIEKERAYEDASRATLALSRSRRNTDDERVRAVIMSLLDAGDAQMHALRLVAECQGTIATRAHLARDDALALAQTRLGNLTRNAFIEGENYTLAVLAAQRQ